jgi:hypothetical protein
MDIDRRKALVLLSVVAIAAITGTIVMAAHSAEDEESDKRCIQEFGRRMLGGINSWRMRNQERCLQRFIEVSDEFKENVISIAEGDEDVQDLLDDGYNITDVKPIIKAVVEGDGSVDTRATEAIIGLENDETGRAVVWVDLDEASMTKIVILTRTVIEKP